MIMSEKMDKSQLRDIQKQKMKAVVGHQQHHQEEALLQEKLFHSDYWQNAKTVAVTLSLPWEVDTQAIITRAWYDNKSVVVPKILNHNMHFVPLTMDTKLKKGQLAISEPEQADAVAINTIDLVIVPGLAFDQRGARLGQGAGYYDRFLSQYTGHTIAIATSELFVDHVPTEPHDQFVQYVITKENNA